MTLKGENAVVLCTCSASSKDLRLSEAVRLLLSCGAECRAQPYWSVKLHEHAIAEGCIVASAHHVHCLVCRKGGVFQTTKSTDVWDVDFEDDGQPRVVYCTEVRTACGSCFGWCPGKAAPSTFSAALSLLSSSTLEKRGISITLFKSAQDREDVARAVGAVYDKTTQLHARADRSVGLARAYAIRAAFEQKNSFAYVYASNTEPEAVVVGRWGTDGTVAVCELDVVVGVPARGRLLLASIQTDCTSTSAFSRLLQTHQCTRVRLTLDSVPQAVPSYLKCRFHLTGDLTVQRGEEVLAIPPAVMQHYFDDGWVIDESVGLYPMVFEAEIHPQANRA